MTWCGALGNQLAPLTAGGVIPVLGRVLWRRRGVRMHGVRIYTWYGNPLSPLSGSPSSSSSSTCPIYASLHLLHFLPLPITSLPRLPQQHIPSCKGSDRRRQRGLHLCPVLQDRLLPHRRLTALLQGVLRHDKSELVQLYWERRGAGYPLARGNVLVHTGVDVSSLSQCTNVY